MRIVIDTNFLIYTVTFGLLQQIEKPDITLIVPSIVLEELEKLSEREKKARDRDAAKFALYYVYKTGIKIVKTEIRRADEAVMDVAKKEKAYLATMDEMLARNAKARGLKIVGIRQQRYIALP
jgi:rRNA-processing protein FCF1